MRQKAFPFTETEFPDRRPALRKPWRFRDGVIKAVVDMA